MVVQSLDAARKLQKPQPDFSILASALSMSNTLEEGFESGDFGELGPEFEDYTWLRDIREVGSNGLFEVDFTIEQKHARRGEHPETMSVLMFKPGGKKKL
jgi:hypothetical protein